MNRLNATLAACAIGLALLGCDDKSSTPAAQPGTGAGAGVGVGGSSGTDPSVSPKAGGDATSSARPMAGSGGVGNVGSMNPEGASNATGANNVAGGAHSTTQPSPVP